MMAQILEESKCKINLLDKIAKNTFSKSHAWINSQQNNFVAQYFRKNLSLSQSILSKDIQEESKVNIPLGEKIEVKQDVISPTSQENKEVDSSLSLVEFPTHDMSESKTTKPINNKETVKDDKKIEEIAEESQDYDSLSFVPDPNFLKNINQNMKFNDDKITEKVPEPIGSKIEDNKKNECFHISNITISQEGTPLPNVTNKVESINGLSFPTFFEKEMNESDDEKDITVNGKLYDQQKKAKYGIKAYIKK